MRSIWLEYHDVFDGDREPDYVPGSARAYCIARQLFGDHLAVIQASGLTVRTAHASRTVQAPAGDEVVLAFDDGWAGALSVGVEELTRAGLRGTFYITRGFVGRRGYADVPLLRQACQAGMELGAHGTTHRSLHACTEDEIRAEFADARKFLEDAVGAAVTTASLPEGNWTPRIAREVRECGFACLCTSDPSVNRPGTDPFRLHRVAIRRSTTAAAVRDYCRFALLGQVLRHRVLAIPKRLLGLDTYARVRNMLLGGGRQEE